MKKLLSVGVIFLMALFLIGCESEESNNNGDSNGNALDDINGEIDGDPFELLDEFDRVYEKYYEDINVGETVFESPFSLNDTISIIHSIFIEEGSTMESSLFDMSDYGYHANDFPNGRAYTGTREIANVAFEPDGNVTRVEIILIDKDVYYADPGLDLDEEDFMTMIPPVEEAEFLSYEEFPYTQEDWVDIKITYRSAMDMMEVGAFYVDFFEDADEWTIISNSLVDESNYWYGREDRFEVFVRNPELNDLSVFVFLTIPSQWDEMYQEGTIILSITYIEVPE